MGITCPEGTHCVGGACIDSCEGAICPEGEMCETGRCVPEEGPPPPPPTPDAGMMMSMPDATPMVPDADPGPDCPPGLECADAGGGVGTQDAGCACTVIGHGEDLPVSAWFVLGLMGLILRRRRLRPS